MPKVSVIIPVYNVEEYLRQCLDSVINQTLQDIEIICVDDGSTDNSLAILEEYASRDDRIKILKQQNSGAAIARNLGMDNANADYLYFFDSDDFLELDAIEKIYKKISTEKADICLFKFKTYDEDKHTCREVINSLKLDSDLKGKNIISSKKIFQICATNVWTKLYTKKFIIENNLRFQNLRTCNDVYFNIMTLACAKKITYLEEYLINYRQDAKNNLSSTRGKYAENIILAYKECEKELKKRKLFKYIKKSFYKIAIRNFNYELNNTDNEHKTNLLNEIYKFLPQKYLSEEMLKYYHYKSFWNNIFIKVYIGEKKYYIFNINQVFQNIFSIKNSGDRKHKIITLLGIKFSFRRKKYA